MEPLTAEHLRQLGQLAREDQESFFSRNPRYARCQRQLLCIALCQGGALHYIDGRNGVKDLDVWVFYADSDGPSMPPRRRREMWFLNSGLTGWSERVDVMARSIPRVPDPNPVASVAAYLRKPQTRTAWELSRKAVVLIEPADRLGEIIWHTEASRV